MRAYPKYKNLYQSKKIITTCLSRVLQFKKSKWSSLQNLLLAFLKRKKQPNFVKSLKFTKKEQKDRQVYCYKNTIEPSAKVKSWLRLKLYHKNFFHTKTLFKQLFGDIKPIFPKKKQSSAASGYCFQYLVKPYYRVDILLWKLNFFWSVHQARQSIKFGEIFVNGCSIKSNTFLEKGDVITFSKKCLFSSSVIQSVALKQTIYLTRPVLTFVETDYYNKIFIIVKGLSELNRNDFPMLTPGDIDLKMLKPFT